MARPREFDIDEALDGAMQAFWAKGYDGTSLPDLLEAMKIARGSLYKAFRDKRSIYLAALDRYNHREVQQAVDILADRRTGDGSARIRRFLDDARAAVVRRNDRRGCFLCNAAVEQAPMDGEVRDKVSVMIKRMEHTVVAALEDADVASTWPARRRSLVALMLINSYLGLRVFARSGAPAKELSATRHPRPKDRKPFRQDALLLGFRRAAVHGGADTDGVADTYVRRIHGAATQGNCYGQGE